MTWKGSGRGGRGRWWWLGALDWMRQGNQYNEGCGQDGRRAGGCLTRNFRFCFQRLPWALVAMWASVTIRMRSHSSWVGSSRSHTVFCSSSFRRRSRFSSISFRFASLLLSSNTTEVEGREGEQKIKEEEEEGNA